MQDTLEIVSVWQKFKLPQLIVNDKKYIRNTTEASEYLQTLQNLHNFFKWTSFLRVSQPTIRHQFF